MKILGIMFCVLFLLMFIFCKVKVNGSTDITIIQRTLACLFGSFLLTLIFGLPILGIIYLLGIQNKDFNGILEVKNGKIFL